MYNPYQPTFNNQPYNPMMPTMPQMNLANSAYNATQTMGPQLTFVNGIDSAKAYPTQPNSRVALFDENDDVMYIKTTDASNFPTITRYRFTEEKESEKTASETYVTVEEFNKFKEEILNAQQSLSAGKSNTNAKSKWNGKQPATNKEHDANSQEQ